MPVSTHLRMSGSRVSASIREPATYCASLVCFLIPTPAAFVTRASGWVRAHLANDIVIFVAFALAGALIGIVHHARTLARINAELQRARDLAAHREHERDLAQQELMHKLDEERELAKEKMQFEAQLSEYEKYAALAQLALGAAHEINNPLLGILSHLELELDEARDEENRSEIEQCIEGSKRISAAVRGLLNYARPGPLLISKISLDRLVTDSLSFLAHQPMFRGIRMVKRIPDDLPQVSADANQLSQILMNLLLNSAQATKEGDAITVSAQKVKFDEAVEVIVSDTGCGIPADILPHVFEPFFTTKRGKGTGLGLSISQSYIRSHGGDIRIDSVPGRGTTVHMRLPIRQEGRTVTKDEEVVA
jgi:signal transduction histidine kinase